MKKLIFKFTAIFLIFILPTSVLAFKKEPLGIFQGLLLLKKLDLSKAQVDQIINILEKYKIKRNLLIPELIKARRNLNRIIHSEDKTEDDIRRAFRKVSRIREDLIVLNAKMIKEIKEVLTEEQINILERIRKKRRFRKYFIENFK